VLPPCEKLRYEGAEMDKNWRIPVLLDAGSFRQVGNVGVALLPGEVLARVRIPT